MGERTWKTEGNQSNAFGFKW